jgi:hypothetical protein
MAWEGEAEAGVAKLTSMTCVWVKRRGGRPPRWKEKGSGGGAARGEYRARACPLLARVRVSNDRSGDRTAAVGGLLYPTECGREGK